MLSIGSKVVLQCIMLSRYWGCTTYCAYSFVSVAFEFKFWLHFYYQFVRIFLTVYNRSSVSKCDFRFRFFRNKICPNFYHLVPGIVSRFNVWSNQVNFLILFYSAQQFLGCYFSIILSYLIDFKLIYVLVVRVETVLFSRFHFSLIISTCY